MFLDSTSVEIGVKVVETAVMRWYDAKLVPFEKSRDKLFTSKCVKHFLQFYVSVRCKFR